MPTESEGERVGVKGISSNQREGEGEGKTVAKSGERGENCPLVKASKKKAIGKKGRG